ncbi:TlpA disulfide reductase family protein [Bradyrhizobium sp. BTAi1]|jgi:thiol-disulfide isomerase/thioredoxin|uniref:TlpA family protein disulfide reductase n=1 Tax=Bradyrhizobium sp. (strain BTAi1 / ATCC BAA-1182) TaxID=288000 RepID=UPI00005DF5DD
MTYPSQIVLTILRLRGRRALPRQRYRRHATNAAVSSVMALSSIAFSADPLEQPNDEPMTRSRCPAPCRRGWSRRRVLLNAVTTILPSLVTLDAAPAAPGDPPSFQSGRFQFTVLSPAQELPSVRLFGLHGGTLDLAALRGKPIVLNFWASWCAACRMELPVLDRLHQRTDLEVVTVALDRRGRDTVSRYAEQLKLNGLPIYLDPNGYVASLDRDNLRNAPFLLYGMPITYLITRSGRIVGYMPGAADWLAADAQPLLEYLRNA